MIEADFQREYGIVLVVEISRMTWRRFLVLLQGLGPGSLWAHVKAHTGPEPGTIVVPRGKSDQALDEIAALAG